MRRALILLCLFGLTGCDAASGGSGPEGVEDAAVPQPDGNTPPQDGVAPGDDVVVPPVGADSGPGHPDGGPTLPDATITPTDDTAVGPPPVTDGNVGGACTATTDCIGTQAICLNMPGGYCSLSGCEGGTNPCPEGSQCFLFQNGDSYCLDTCTTSAECREDEGYICDVDGTCWPGEAGTPNTGDSPVGGPCLTNEDCADSGAVCYPEMLNGESTGFIGGYCMIWNCTAGACPAGSQCLQVGAGGEMACMATCATNAECRDDEGYGCLDPGMCFAYCGQDAPCPTNYACDAAKSMCKPDCQSGSCPGDLVCGDSGLCEKPPCTAGSCPAGLVCGQSGICVPDVGGGPGQGPGPSCSNLPSKDCTGTQAYCAELIPFEPVEGPGYVNYPLNGETWANQYRSYARRDLVMLIQWATAYVACKSPTWEGGNGYPLGLGDMSEVNGAIPGTSIGSPGHPAGTHTDGYDIDVAYYQNELTGQANNYLRAICDHTIGGVEQYHCVSEPYMMDLWRSALFIGALFSSDRTRVIGVDGKAGAMISQALEVLCADGWVPSAGCVPANQSLACEVEAGVDGGLCWEENGSMWFLHHHHHLHLSLWTLAGGTWPSTDPKEKCLDEDCKASTDMMKALEALSAPGLVKSIHEPMGLLDPTQAASQPALP